MMLRSILMALSMLGAPKDVAQQMAPALLRYSGGDAALIAFMLADAKSESHFLDRIAKGKCERWECDARKHGDGSITHMAIGLWQAHRGVAGKDWDELPGNIDAQARVAARMSRYALKTCNGNARCAFRVLGGLRVDVPLKGEDVRVADFTRALRML